MKERYTCPHVIPNVLQMWVDKCLIEVYILCNLLKISDVNTQPPTHGKCEYPSINLFFSFYLIYSHWLKAFSWRFHVISLRMLIIYCMFDRTLFSVHCHVSLLFRKTLANNPLNLVCHIRVTINCILIKRLNNNWNWYTALYIVVEKN